MSAQALAVPVRRAARGSVAWSDAPVAVVSAGAVIGLGFSFGGYFPSTWGWAALGLAWAAALALLLRTVVHIGLLELVLLGAIAALTGWIALSVLWSSRVPQTIFEIQRTLVYVAALAAVLLVSRSRAAYALLGGVLAGTVAVVGWALSARLFPDRIRQIEDEVGGYRLDEPIGYWNALGLVAVVGVLLAVGFASRGSSLGARGAAAASTVVTMPALYFTFGRGPWLALAIGLLALVAFDARRLQTCALLVVLAPLPAAAVWIASESGPLTERGVAIEEVAREGDRYAVIVLLLAAGAAAVAVVFALAERHLRIPRGVRLGWAGVLTVGAVVGLALVFARYGGPMTLAEKGYDSFRSPPVGVNTGESGAKRLFTLSSNGRLDMWEVAWQSFRDRPLLGTGAGTWERAWVQERKVPGTARDAHSLYVEMLAEVGIVGLALLLIVLAVPLVAATRIRRRRLVPAALAAYVAFLAHAGVDWDWEIPATTLPGLLCGAAIVLAARPAGSVRQLGRIARGAGVAAAIAIAAIAFVGAIGNTAIRETEKALLQDLDRERALEEGRRATSWAPWSSDAWMWRSRAEGASNLRARSIDSIREAIDRDPENWELWLDLAYSYNGNDPATRPARIAAVRRALDLNPLATEIALALEEDQELLGLTAEDVQRG